MKRILPFIVVLMFSMVSVSFAAERETFSGTMSKDKKDIQIEDYFIPIKDLKKTTKEFQNCINGGKYKGEVEINANVQRAKYGSSVFLDKTSTCKRK